MLTAPTSASTLHRWATAVVGGYILVTALSWVPMTAGVNRTIVRAAIVTWLTVSSAGWIVAIARSSSRDSLLQHVKRVIVAVGFCGVVAAPMMTRDLWCYVGFARLAASGVSPYSTALPDGILGENGPECFGTTTYGPVWTYGAVILDRIAAPLGLIAEVVVLKLAIAAAWLAMVGAGAWLFRKRDVKTGSVALAALAVAPLSTFEVVAEAHNDVVMIALAMGWLVLRAKDSWLSPIPLALSALVKYVTAPLLIIAIIDSWRRRRYAESACAMVAAAVIAIVVGLIYREGGFSSLTTHNATWRWLSAPFAIELALKNVTPNSWSTLVTPAVWGWRALLMLGVAWYMWLWARARHHDLAFYRVLAAGMLAVILSADYLWPWYLIWALPFVILAEDRVLSAVAWPCFLVIPIAQACWAGGIRAHGYRTPVILFLLGLIVVAWIAQPWLQWRGRPLLLRRDEPAA